MDLRDFITGAIFGMFLILSIAAAPHLQKVTGNAIELYAGLSVVYNLDMERGPENYFVGDGTLVFTGEDDQRFEQLNIPLPIKQ